MIISIGVTRVIQLRPGRDDSTRSKTNNLWLIMALWLWLVTIPVPAMANWSDEYAIQGVRGDVHAAVIFQGDLWVAGSFEQAGSAFVRNVARWDGSSWHSSGQIDGIVRALVVHDGVLYAGGSIDGVEGQAASGLAVLHDEVWEPWLSIESPGSTRPPVVFTLHSTDEALFIGGRFSQIDGIEQNSLAVWQNEVIDPDFPSLGSENECRDIVGSSESLYVGGELSEAGEVPVRGIAHWDGITWNDLDGGLDGAVHALLENEDGLYAGGDFFHEDQSGIRSIGRWTGSEWEALDGGVRGESPIVRALLTYQGEVVVGGDFTIAGSRQVNRMVRWADEQWGTMSGAMSSGRIRALTGYRGTVLAAGNFTQASSHTAYSVATWNGFWNPVGVGRGMDAAVLDLSPYEDQILAGGAFVRAGRSLAGRISIWTGTKWTAENTQFNDWVLAVAGIDNLIAAGGIFTRGGVAQARHVALREDGAWFAPRGGAAAIVRVLGQYNGELIAGGPFFRAGGIPARAIASWDGKTWAPLETGLGGEPLAFLEWEGDLLVAGRFTEAGNQPADYLARWDGRFWTPGPPGLEFPVHELTTWEGQLVAAGEGPGTPPSGRVQIWDGSSWVELGIGFDGTVLAVAPFQNRLAACGLFRSADGKPAAGLAVWDGRSWNEIPGAVSGGRAEVHDLVIDPTDSDVLWVGGDFLQVDSIWSNHIARWEGPLPTWVWPGDTDNDGLVEIRDLFPIARYWESSGPPRDRSDSWTGEPVDEWLLRLAAHADADGSGRVDGDDLLVLIDNWGRTRRTNEEGGIVPSLTPAEIALELRANLPAGTVGDALREALDGLSGRQPELRVSQVALGKVALTWKQTESGPASLQIIDLQGRIVRTLYDETTEAGQVRVDWAGSNDQGDAVPSGIYFARLLRSGQPARSAKVVWLR